MPKRARNFSGRWKAWDHSGSPMPKSHRPRSPNGSVIYTIAARSACPTPAAGKRCWSRCGPDLLPVGEGMVFSFSLKGEGGRRPVEGGLLNSEGLMPLIRPCGAPSPRGRRHDGGTCGKEPRMGDNGGKHPGSNRLRWAILLALILISSQGTSVLAQEPSKD